MKSIEEMSQAELAAFVQTKLLEQGIDVILSGGACVAFYSQNRYTTKDIDLVNAHSVKRKEISAVLFSLGFQENGRHFVHPDSPYLVEFPAGPLSVGSEPVRAINQVQLQTGVLKIISPTDAVKDRLLHYFYWKDFQGLEQAILIANQYELDVREIERWAENEKLLDPYRAVAARLQRH